VGRGELPFARASRRSAPGAFNMPKELAEECLWGGSAPPNGSRSSCGRNSRWRKAAERPIEFAG